MKLTVVTVGAPKFQFVRAGVELYEKRLQATGGFAWITVKGSNRDIEGEKLLRASRGLRVVLDESGEQVSSQKLAAHFSQWEGEGRREVFFLVGGADGHSPEVKKSADWVWSLGCLTLQHELALLVLVEQLYRAGTILRGKPYHRP